MKKNFLITFIVLAAVSLFSLIAILSFFSISTVQKVSNEVSGIEYKKYTNENFSVIIIYEELVFITEFDTIKEKADITCAPVFLEKNGQKIDFDRLKDSLSLIFDTTADRIAELSETDIIKINEEIGGTEYSGRFYAGTDIKNVLSKAECPSADERLFCAKLINAFITKILKSEKFDYIYSCSNISFKDIYEYKEIALNCLNNCSFKTINGEYDNHKFIVSEATS